MNVLDLFSAKELDMADVINLQSLAPVRECPSCDKSHLRRRFTNEKFPYLDGKAQMILEASVPVWSCDQCGFEFTDAEAEAIRHSVVCQHLGRL